MIHITGDEPHYLLIATSLLRDGDLDVLNNYRDKHYQPFYPYHLGDARKPEDMHALYGPGGGLYSKHGVGLPLLLLPAMRLGGTEGGHGLAIVFMLGVAAALSTQIFFLARETTGRAAVAILAWAAVAFTSPLLLYAGQIYPEVPGALLVVWGVRAVWRAGARTPVGYGRRPAPGHRGGAPPLAAPALRPPGRRAGAWPAWSPAPPACASSGPGWRPPGGGGGAAAGPQLAPLRGPPGGRRVRHLRRAERPHRHPGALLRPAVRAPGLRPGVPDRPLRAAPRPAPPARPAGGRAPGHAGAVRPLRGRLQLLVRGLQSPLADAGAGAPAAGGAPGPGPGAVAGRPLPPGQRRPAPAQLRPSPAC